MKQSLRADIIIALIITIGLFIGSLGIFGAAANQHVYNVEAKCHDRHQITMKEVLHCD